MMPEKEKTIDEEFELEVERVIPDNMRSTFVNHFVVQNAGFNEFHISFFEIKHPILLDEAAKEKIKEEGKVKAECVGRFVVTGERLPTFIAALARVYSQSTNQSTQDILQHDQSNKHVG